MIDKETFAQFKDFVDHMDPPVYSEEQRQALSGKLPMTQEIFDGCVISCVVQGNLKALFDLFAWFPDCGKVFCARLEQDLNLIDAHLREKGLSKSPEVIQGRWNAFLNHVSVVFGDEMADSLSRRDF